MVILPRQREDATLKFVHTGAPGFGSALFRSRDMNNSDLQELEERTSEISNAEWADILTRAEEPPTKYMNVLGLLEQTLRYEEVPTDDGLTDPAYIRELKDAIQIIKNCNYVITEDET